MKWLVFEYRPRKFITFPRKIRKIENIMLNFRKILKKHKSKLFSKFARNLEIM